MALLLAVLGVAGGLGASGLFGAVGGRFLGAARPAAAQDATVAPGGAPSGSAVAGGDAATAGDGASSTSVVKVGDSKARTTVNRVIAALLGVAVVVLVATIWYWRSTKPFPGALEGLDTMSRRKWRKADAAEQRAAVTRAKGWPGA